MGVYDHMMRPSMGHKMQVELRDSMQHYQGNKIMLQQNFSQLCFDNKELYIGQPPSSPLAPAKKWEDPDSKFSKAPEMAAQKARLAKLEQQNANLTVQSMDNNPKGKTSLLPPILDSETNDIGMETTNTTGEEQTSQKSTNKPAGTKETQKTQQDKKLGNKGRKFQKKQTVKKSTQQQDKPHSVLKLPTIYSAGLKRSVWDSGRNHVHLKGQSTHLEKNQTDEECRNLSHHTVSIPPIVDTKRREIQRPLQLQRSGTLTKVQFTRRQPPPPPPVPDIQVSHAVQVITNSSPIHSHYPKPLPKDHFPQNVPRLPELDDCSTDSEDESRPSDRNQTKRSTLPALKLNQVTKLPYSRQATTLVVPSLRLQGCTTPGAISMTTARSGATGATHMSHVSQETQEWKDMYMTTENPYYKGRMLSDILHAVRQRMHDNEEDLRMSGEHPRPGAQWNMEKSSEVILLHGQSNSGSGATTSRSTASVFKLSHNPKKKAAGQSQSSKLQNYLNKLTNKRKAGDLRHHDHASLQMANMTIREITQSSIDRQSQVQTTS